MTSTNQNEIMLRKCSECKKEKQVDANNHCIDCWYEMQCNSRMTRSERRKELIVDILHSPIDFLFWFGRRFKERPRYCICECEPQITINMYTQSFTEKKN